MLHTEGVRFSRRLVALSVVWSSSALVALWGCSTPDSHPPILGDCVGPLCPPAQNRGVSTSSGGGSDAGDAGGAGTVDSGGGGTLDSGGGGTDSGGDTGAIDDGGADGSLPVDSGGD